MWKFTFSLVFLWLSLTGLAQQKTKPSTTSTTMEEEKDYRPTMLKFSYDFIALGESLVSSARTGQQFQASIDFYNYYLIGEYGFQQSRRGEDFDYENSGSYFRIGPEVNFLKNSDKNSLTFGLRYAHASFNDKISFTRSSQTFGDTDITASNPDVKANWLELTAGLNVNVWKGLYMGYVIRYQIYRSLKNAEAMVPYEIPGFGLEQNRQGVGFSYFIGWAIPLRKVEEIPEEEGL